MWNQTRVKWLNTLPCMASNHTYTPMTLNQTRPHDQIKHPHAWHHIKHPHGIRSIPACMTSNKTPSCMASNQTPPCMVWHQIKHPMALDQYPMHGVKSNTLMHGITPNTPMHGIKSNTPMASDKYPMLGIKSNTYQWHKIKHPQAWFQIETLMPLCIYQITMHGMASNQTLQASRHPRRVHANKQYVGHERTNQTALRPLNRRIRGVFNK